jgi:Ni/Co efflux regulator RcnB
MKSSVQTKVALALLVGGLLTSGAPVMAGQPDWAGGKGKSDQSDRGNQRHDQRDDRADKRDHQRNDRNRRADYRNHFEDRHNVMVRDYYAQQYRGGRCPPGLAKKNNGCMPPGQAKKWTMGRPLPRNVVYHNVPQPLISQLGAPPAGHQYVRVASDILLIAINNGTVVSAIQNFGR